MANMRLKNLQGHLNQLSGFKGPKIRLEQYVTPPHLAAHFLWSIQTIYDDIEDKIVLDAGCGPGTLSIGASLLGAAYVTAVEIDSDALDIFKENVDDMEITNVDPVLQDFLLTDVDRWGKYFDTVIMNPPFGTKNNIGIDLKFLRMATYLSSNTVYSIHKSVTRSHIRSKVQEWGMKGDPIRQVRYDLPATYKFHKNDSWDINVDIWRLQHRH